MERTQKTYECTKAMQLDTYVLVKGVKLPIEFRGGTIEPRKNGTYSVSDVDIIEALDADIARVGSEVASYRCIHEEVLLLDNPETGPTKQLVPDIKTVTAAKEWLITASATGIIKEGITSSMIKNRTDVLTICEETGIEFTELPKE